MPASLPSTPAAHWRPAAFVPSIPPAWRRRLRIGALIVAIALALFAGVGFLAIPRIAKWQIESLAKSELSREATVGRVSFNPFTLRGAVADFTLSDRDPGRSLLKFDLLDVDLSASSLWKLALVVDGMRLVRPRIELSRDAAGKTSIQDLFERPAAPPGEKRETPFAVNNIEVEDGTVVFDDAMRGHRTEISHLAIGVPFLSGLSGDAQIRVRPHLQGAVDGAQFALSGQTSSPFADTQRATLEIDLDALPLPRYVEYAALPNGLKLTDGALTTRLTLAFITWKGKPRSIHLTGNARLDKLALARKDGSPLIGLKSVDVALKHLDPLQRSIVFDRISVAEPQIDLRRLADGSLELPGLLETGSKGEPGAPWTWSVSEAGITGGSVRLLDSAVSPPMQLRLVGATVSAAKIASKGDAGTVDAAFDTEDGAHFSAHADVDVPKQGARGHFALTRLGLPALHPYYRNLLAIDLKRGTLDLGGDFDVGAPGRVMLRQGTVTLSDLDVSVRGERQSLVRLAEADANGITLDLAARTLTIDSVAADKGALQLLREPDGSMHFQRIFPAPSHPAAAAKPAAQAGWHVVVHRVAAQNIATDFEDRAIKPAVKLKVADTRITAENIDTTPGTKVTVDVASRIGAKGRVGAKGTASMQPLSLDWRIDANGVDLVPFRPYFESRTNVILTSGAMSARGRVTYATTRAGSADVRYRGNVIVSNFGSLDRPGAQELVRFRTLAVTGADLDTAPFKFAANVITLDGLYARLVLDADAKLNVLKLLGEEPGTPESSPASPASGGVAAERAEIPAAIAQIQLTDGEVEFSDFFVKPNYSAHLTNVNGTVSGLAAKQEGTVEITARVEGSAPVDIRGTLNPFGKQLAMDITGKATDVDLPPLTPYSVKYAGYGIQKGKLSMEVHYKLEDRKLTATNKLRLDQLTFGERVDSPTATKLPVLLAVKLLQDRNGVIALDLPISGTLDDPKFSMWRIVVQIIGNLLTKAATAPFALLGALVGGGEQLAYVEFAPGQATITPAAEAKLQALSKALTDRPGLRLDAAGRAIADVDGEGLRQAALERALRIAKQKALAEAGESAPPLEQIRIEAAERDKYLKAAYRAAELPNKPRNFIGMAKDIPPAEMEKLLLAGYKVDENALRELAGHRAQAVKDWLTTKGKIPGERVFVSAAKLDAQGVKGEGAPTRVDFAIK